MMLSVHLSFLWNIISEKFFNDALYNQGQFKIRCSIYYVFSLCPRPIPIQMKTFLASFNLFYKLPVLPKGFASLLIWRSLYKVVVIDLFSLRYWTLFKSVHFWKKTNDQSTFKNVNNYLNTNIYSYLDTSGGQSSKLCLKCSSFFQHQS